MGSSGPDEVMFASKEAKNLTDWSPDGKYVLFSSQSPTTARDVWALPVDGADRKPFPVAQTAAGETNGKFSPDGKWVAYQSDETGHDEVFVRPFPGPGPSVRVSTGGGQGAFWRHDGKELFYRTTDDHLMAVSVSASGKGTLDFGLPQSLFKIKGSIVPETDGQRFLWLLPIGNDSQPPITVIVNWAAGHQK
jgi:Tol biopolymer transport system component